MPLISEETAITSERMYLTSEEIIIIGERIALKFGKNILYWGR